MKIKKSRIMSVEYSTTMTKNELLELVKSHFITRLALELKGDSVNSTDFDLDDIIVSIDENAVATISYRRDQGSRAEKNHD